MLASNYSSAFGGDPTKSALSVFIDSLGYIFDTNYIMPSGELGRFTTLFFWLQHNELFGPGGMLFGYGLNATNSGSTVSPGYIGTVSPDPRFYRLEHAAVGSGDYRHHSVHWHHRLHPVAMRPKETFRATISSLRICNSLARHRRSMFCHRLSAQPAVQPDPDDHSHATVLLWLSLGALIVIHRAVRLNSGTHYE